MFLKTVLISLFLQCFASSYADFAKPKEEHYDKFGLLGSFSGVSSGCGDTLRASVATGAITYKNFEPVQPNERCVWTIRRPNATYYTVTLRSMGTPSSLIIFGVRARGIVDTYTPTGPTSLTVTNSSLLVITFHTGTTVSGTGFSLEFSASTSGSLQYVSELSEDILKPGSVGHIKYPAGRSLYGNYEVSTFTFTPVADTSGKFKKTEVIYVRDQIESVYDTLHIYTFDASISTANKWRYLGEITGLTDADLIANNDLILVIFQSDASTGYSGFHLYSKIVN